MEDAGRQFVVSEPARPAGVQAFAREMLVQLRVEKGWSQSELARQVTPQTTPTQIRKLELGPEQGGLYLSLEWLEKLAKPLGVTISAFLPPHQVELHTDSSTAALLDMMRDIPEAERPILARAARDLVAVARRLGGGSSGPVLEGDPILAERLAARWNGWSEPQRQRATDLLEVAEGMASP